jgi:hypothetical protein
MSRIAPVLGISLLLVLLASLLNAGQVRVFVEEQSAAGDTIGAYTIHAANSHGVNMEFKHRKQHGAMIWSKLEKTAWMIDYVDGTYWAITEQDAAEVKKMRAEVESKMGAQQQEVMKLLEEQMKGMSDKEKQMVLENMPGGLGEGLVEESKTVYEEEGSESIGNWGKTAVYLGRIGGETVEKVWTVDWKKAGISESDLKIFSEFQEFMEGLMGEDGKESSFKFAQVEEEQGYPGLAVRKDQFDRNGKRKASEFVRVVEKQEANPAKYRLPDTQELKKIESPFEEMKGSFQESKLKP